MEVNDIVNNTPTAAESVAKGNRKRKASITASDSLNPKRPRSERSFGVVRRKTIDTVENHEENAKDSKISNADTENDCEMSNEVPSPQNDSSNPLPTPTPDLKYDRPTTLEGDHEYICQFFPQSDSEEIWKKLTEFADVKDRVRKVARFMEFKYGYPK